MLCCGGFVKPAFSTIFLTAFGKGKDERQLKPAVLRGNTEKDRIPARHPAIDPLHTFCYNTPTSQEGKNGNTKL